MSDQLQKTEELIKAGRFDEAEAILRRLVKRRKSKFDALFRLGIIEERRQRYQKAWVFYTRANGVASNVPEVHFNLSVVLRHLGEHDKAKDHLRQAILLNPDYGRSFATFSDTVRFQPGHPMIAVIEDRLAREGLSQEDRCHFHFAAGKAYDDIGEYDRAMAHFHQGNAAKDVKDSPDTIPEKIRRIAASFTRDRFAALADIGSADERIVFVVGMPRSGTSLVEQIIASHPKAHGAGELHYISLTVSSLVESRLRSLAESRALAQRDLQETKGVEDISLADHAAQYLEDIDRLVTRQGMSANTERIVDKMPTNFQYLGWIRLMFPKARIIHCRRDPRDTCLSCFFQNFALGNEYSFDLSNLGFYYRYYATIMRHWRDVLGIEMLEVDYERLATDPEPAMREIIAYCGLPWDDACLSFHKTKRPVLTASSWQVRQPLYQRSVGRWRNYEKHLGPLLKALRGETKIPAAD